MDNTESEMSEEGKALLDCISRLEAAAALSHSHPPVCVVRGSILSCLLGIKGSSSL